MSFRPCLEEEEIQITTKGQSHEAFPYLSHSGWELTSWRSGTGGRNGSSDGCPTAHPAAHRRYGTEARGYDASAADAASPDGVDSWCRWVFCEISADKSMTSVTPEPFPFTRLVLPKWMEWYTRGNTNSGFWEYATFWSSQHVCVRRYQSFSAKGSAYSQLLAPRSPQKVRACNMHMHTYRKYQRGSMPRAEPGLPFTL